MNRPTTETSRAERRSARLPRLRPEAEADPDPTEVRVVVDESDLTVDLTDVETRYQRHSAALPHLSDDPAWRPRRTELPGPASR